VVNINQPRLKFLPNSSGGDGFHTGKSIFATLLCCKRLSTSLLVEESYDLYILNTN